MIRTTQSRYAHATGLISLDKRSATGSRRARQGHEATQRTLNPAAEVKFAALVPDCYQPKAAWSTTAPETSQLPLAANPIPRDRKTGFSGPGRFQGLFAARV